MEEQTDRGGQCVIVSGINHETTVADRGRHITHGAGHYGEPGHHVLDDLEGGEIEEIVGGVGSDSNCRIEQDGRNSVLAERSGHRDSVIDSRGASPVHQFAYTQPAPDHHDAHGGVAARNGGDHVGEATYPMPGLGMAEKRKGAAPRMGRRYRKRGGIDSIGNYDNPVAPTPQPLDIVSERPGDHHDRISFTKKPIFGGMLSEAHRRVALCEGLDG